MNQEALERSGKEAFAGLLLGTAVGDAVGLPAEGLSRQRSQRWWKGQWQHRFFLGRGMCSDDTEHTLFVAQALLAHPGDPIAFQRCLAWKLRFWLLGLPAGLGLATLKAILKLWAGFSPASSGVRSAGNGPAMRSAIIGAFLAEDAEKRRAFVAAATRLTHTDPRAEVAAQAVADAAAWIQNHPADPGGFLANLAQSSADPEWQAILTKMGNALARGEETTQFANSLGLERGVTGYAYHSVPVALYAWLRHPDEFRVGLESALNCGGDTDTVGAIAGALLGTSVGVAGIPAPWLVGLAEWPRSQALLLKLADHLADQKPANSRKGPVRYFWPGLVIRNVLFLAIVLLHGFRRLLPSF